MGFKLPPSNAYTGFTTTGEYVSTLSQINGEWDSSLKGWNFYTDSSKNKTIFFLSLIHILWLLGRGNHNEKGGKQ